LALFLSTFVNKIDKKGRVSVPASFRAALNAQTFAGIVAFPSFTLAALECSGMDRFEQLANSVDELDPFSDQRDNLATAIFARTVQMPFDGEGRIMLSEPLLAHAGLDDQAAFVGQGRTFQIWSPSALDAHVKAAAQQARDNRAALKIGPRNPQGAGS